MRFVERQRLGRRWIALVDLADWCAQSTTRASVAEEDDARELAYRRLVESVLIGEFERDGTSKILCLAPDVFADGTSPRFRLTREQFGFGASGNAPDLLRGCWLRAEMARQWIETHGYHWPVHFEAGPVADSVTLATGAPGRPAKGMHLISAEFKRRIAKNTCKPSLREEAAELEQWYRRQHPRAPSPSVKTIENNIRSDYRSWRTESA
jgi:hypothetical protein